VVSWPTRKHQGVSIVLLPWLLLCLDTSAEARPAAIAPKMWNTSRPDEVVVSIPLVSPERAVTTAPPAGGGADTSG
jgi:hypothetical protein